jgi:negative regulator of sigma E activity
MSTSSNNTLNESLAEKMSAAIDDQSSEFELRQLLKAIENGDDQLMDQWQTQHESKDVLDGIETNFDLSTSIMAEVSLTEQELDQPESASANDKESVVANKFRWSWVANAASVAAVAVFVVAFGNQSLDNADISLQVAEADNALQQQVVQRAAQQRLQSYINEHAQQASYTGGRAVVLTVADAIEKEKADGFNE